MKSYKFRAECLIDVNRFVAKIQKFKKGKLEHFTVIPSSLPDGSSIPDCEVILKTDLSLKTLIKLASSVVDGHVMSETIEFEENYTGIRRD